MPSPHHAMKDAASMPIRIEQVTDRRALETFVRLPATLYRDDPAWIAPLMMERRHRLTKTRNPYFAHAAADYWIAYRDGEPVGRISAQVDELAQRTQGQGTGHFGFIEAVDDPAVFSALFETAEAWLMARGMVRVLGPFSLSINEESGLLIDGFEHPPRVMMGHARPYYASQLEALGYRKAKDLWAYDLDTEPEFPESAQRILRRAESQPRLTVRDLRLGRLAEDFGIIMEIFNDAWSGNWGYVPFTPAEIARLRSDLRPLLHRHSGRIAYWDGEPVAFLLVVPDLNSLVADLDGRLAPFGWATLLWRLLRRRFPYIRCPLMGVRAKYQNRPVGACMALLLIEQVRSEWRRRNGMRHAELSWVLEDNESMKAVANLLRGVHYKTYRIYQKDLSGLAEPPTRPGPGVFAASQR